MLMRCDLGCNDFEELVSVCFAHVLMEVMCVCVCVFKLSAVSYLVIYCRNVRLVENYCTTRFLAVHMFTEHG